MLSEFLKGQKKKLETVEMQIWSNFILIILGSATLLWKIKVVVQYLIQTCTTS